MAEVSQHRVESHVANQEQAVTFADLKKLRFIKDARQLLRAFGTSMVISFTKILKFLNLSDEAITDRDHLKLLLDEVDKAFVYPNWFSYKTRSRLDQLKSEKGRDTFSEWSHVLDDRKRQVKKHGLHLKAELKRRECRQKADKVVKSKAMHVPHPPKTPKNTGVCLRRPSIRPVNGSPVKTLDVLEETVVGLTPISTSNRQMPVSLQRNLDRMFPSSKIPRFSKRTVLPEITSNSSLIECGRVGQLGYQNLCNVTAKVQPTIRIPRIC